MKAECGPDADQVISGPEIGRKCNIRKGDAHGRRNCKHLDNPSVDSRDEHGGDGALRRAENDVRVDFRYNAGTYFIRAYNHNDV